MKMVRVKKQKQVRMSDTKMGLAPQSDAEMSDNPPSIWGQRTFVETLQGDQEPLQLYLGEDDDREFDEIEELCAVSETSTQIVRPAVRRDKVTKAVEAQVRVV